MKRLLVVILIILISSSMAYAEFLDGNELHRQCQDPDIEQSCNGYIIGVSDALEGIDSGIGKVKFCLPDNVTYGQVTDVTKKWLIDYPDKRHLSASGLVVFSLFTAFPCS